MCKILVPTLQQTFWKDLLSTSVTIAAGISRRTTQSGGGRRISR